MPRNIPAGAFSALLLLAAAPAAALDSPFLATLYAAKCNLEPDGNLTCHFRVGADLDFKMKRITERDVHLEILRNTREGDYYLQPELVERCAVIKHGKRGLANAGGEFNFALVSGKNGLVYRSMRECRLSR